MKHTVISAYDASVIRQPHRSVQPSSAGLRPRTATAQASTEAIAKT